MAAAEGKKRRKVLGGSQPQGNFGSVAEVLANAEAGGPKGPESKGEGLDSQFAKLFTQKRILNMNSAPNRRRPNRASASAAASDSSRGLKRKGGLESAGFAAAASQEGEAAQEGKRESRRDGGDKDKREPANGRGGGKRRRKEPLTEEEKKEREKRLLFVGNVPLDWDEGKLRAAIRAAVGEQYTGPIKPIWFRNEPIKVKYGRKNWKSGHILKDYSEGASDAKIGFAELASPESVKIVMRAVHGYQASPNHILRGDAVGENAKLRTFGKRNSVFVGNLPQDTSESDLRAALGSAGAVDAVRIVRDKEQKACTGVAFVRFTERRSVKAALRLWGAEVRGRQIRIAHVADQSEEGKVKKKHAGEMTPAARRILVKKQRQLRAGVKRAIQRKKEESAALGKRKGTRTNIRRTRGGKVKRKAKR